MPCPKSIAVAGPIIVEGTLEHTCWNIVRKEHGLSPLFLCTGADCSGWCGGCGVALMIIGVLALAFLFLAPALLLE